MDMIDMTIGATWLLCCVFAALRVYFIEKQSPAQPAASPKAGPAEPAQPVNKWKSLIPFFATVVLSLVLLVVLMLLVPNNMLPMYVALLFAVLAVLLYFPASRKKHVMWASPLVFACLATACLPPLLSLINTALYEKTESVKFIVMGVPALVCAILSALQYLFVMTRKKA